MASPSDYISFILDDEEFILLPGFRFSKLELKSRLREMNINDNNSENKVYLNNLYDSAIQDYKNRIKIINRLRKDTINRNSILNLSQKPPMPFNINISKNLPQDKVMNYSQDYNNIYPNLMENQMNMEKPKDNNQVKYVPNPFISSMQNINIGNHNKNRYSYDNKVKLNLNNTGTYNNNNDQLLRKDIKYGNNSYDLNNYENNNEYNFNSINNNYRNNNNNKPNEHINTDINNFTNNKYGQYPYPEKINNNINLRKNKNNIHIIPESNYEDNPDNNDDYNYMNQQNYQKIKIVPQKNLQKKNEQSPSLQINNSKNRMIKKNIQPNNKESFMDALYEGIEVQNKKNVNNKVDEDKNDEDNKKDEENKKENKNLKKDKDEISSFSLFSVFENVKKYPLYKYRKFILIHLIVLLAFLVISISLLHFINNSREEITNFISNCFQFLSEPRRILDLITSFFSLIIFGPIHYWYISIPLLLLGFVFYLFLRKYLFKKRCKEIIEKIVKYLGSGENDKISQEDIYKKIAQSYGISYNKFLKKYLPQMNKLRRNDNRLKLSSMQINEKIYIFWELSQ